MEYCIGEGEYFPVTENFISNGTAAFSDSITGTEPIELKIRNKAIDKPYSFDKIIKIYPRPEAPSSLVLDPVTFTLTGVTTQMEYKLATESKWIKLTSSSISLNKYPTSERDILVDVRYRSTTTAPHSKLATIVLPKLSPAPIGLTIDYINETIKGFDTSKKYQKATSLGSWSSLTLEKDSLSLPGYGFISTSKDNTLYIREAPTQTEPFSDYTTIFIPKRRAAPSAKFIYNDPTTDDTQALLINLTNTMEYRIGTQVWYPCTKESMVVDIGTSAKSCYIREKSTTNAFHSETRSLTLSTFKSSPSSTINLTAETIPNLTSSMEYQINGGNFQPVGNLKTMPLSEIADQLSEGETYTIGLRYMRTETTPVSKLKTITVYPRPASPINPTYTSTTCILSGVAKGMQYREINTTSWKSISGTTISLKTFVNDRPNVQIEVRYAATGKIFASYPVVVNLYD